jgi:hypothetical protein
MKNLNAIGIDEKKSKKLAEKLNVLLANYSIFYQNTRIQASVNLFLLKTEVETSFLLSFDAYIGSLDRLTHSEDAINYILNTGMGTYCNYKIPYNTHWIAIYFNNVNPILLLDLI